MAVLLAAPNPDLPLSAFETLRGEKIVNHFYSASKLSFSFGV